MCRDCFLKAHRKRSKERHAQFGRHKYVLICKACTSSFSGCRKGSILCPSCYTESRKKDSTHTNKYVYDSESYKESGHIWQHRAMAEVVLGRDLKTHEVVHHMDDNPRNNAIENLLVISRVMHGKLHLYLDQQRVIFEKSKSENFENCWKNLIVPITTAWLETTGAKVIKIWGIGQSAAEPLLTAEGSETMHETPDHSVEGDDIVQTTTERAGEIPE